MKNKIWALLVLVIFAVTPGVQAKKSFLCLKTVKKGGRVSQSCRKIEGKRELAATLATIKLLEEGTEAEATAETEEPVVDPDDEGTGETGSEETYCLEHPSDPMCDGSLDI